jgi:hypothetical protein
MKKPSKRKPRCEYQLGVVRPCNNLVKIYFDDLTGRRHCFCSEHEEFADLVRKKMDVDDCLQEL